MSEITLLAEVTAFLRQPHGQFIAGQREAGRGAPFAVINPATGRAIAEVPAADSDQADRAMERARQALSQWREMPTLARGALLLKLADTLAEHREALAQLESLCSGKTITLVRMLELDQSVAFLRYFAGWAGKVTGETLDGKNQKTLILSGACCVIIYFLYNHIRYLSKRCFNLVI